MKHIALFEEMDNKDDFFRDKINWKLSQYITDKLTEVEDKGFFAYHIVEVTMDEDDMVAANCHMIYDSSRDKLSTLSGSNLESAIDMYEQNGLYYTISVTNNGLTNKEYSYTFFENLFQQLKRKFPTLDVVSRGRSSIVIKEYIEY